MSISHSKFEWIVSNDLGRDTQTDGGDNNIPFAFLKRRGDKKRLSPQWIADDASLM